MQEILAKEDPVPRGALGCAALSGLWCDSAARAFGK